MYELYDPCTVMFFYRNDIMIDLGTGNNNKMYTGLLTDNKQELIVIVETVYRGASKGRGLVVSLKGL
ncbi:mitosis protein DIM1-domain-containing protein, partial [Pholiota molesta]